MGTPADAIKIDKVTRRAQDDASDPAASAWVSANAGAGKTFVLARRVVRLLLAGTDPARILCLTFTKAAAAQMATRVFDTLRVWSTLSDRALGNVLADILGRPADAADRARARRLFARALDTPGGLKIQTIHAFCERLLHQFPFEANVAGHFDVLDQRDVDELTDTARRSVLAAAARDGDGPLGRALGTVLSAATDMAHELAVAALIRQRDRLITWIDTHDTLDAALADLRDRLGVAPGDTVAVARAAIVAECALGSDDIARLVGMLRESSKSNDRKAAVRLAPFLEARDDDGRSEAWLDFCTKSDGKLRAAGSVVTGEIKDAWPDLARMLEAEIARLEALLDRIAAVECLETTAAIIRLADAAIDEYTRMKSARGALDFEDLIVKTAKLLSRVDAAQWVHYKLDGGIDHVLVDEAQDTSPRQWQVIATLIEEFFAGKGARETLRTVFAVGDRKQSIFSFQGAAPAWFTAMQRKLSGHAAAAGLTWRDPSLHISFRSVPAVLAAVDKVFAEPVLYGALSDEGAPPEHTAARHAAPGRVVVWPMIEPADKIEPPDWTTPLDHLGEASPEVRLARRIAGTIDGWLREGERLDTGEPIQPGGILILSRIRGAQTDAINRALKSRDVPIAGADRLKLTEHIAVKDLMALGRVVLLPEDDLSLAALLKSPLIGLDEDTLFALAHGRRGTLWQSLAAAAASGACRDAMARLTDWRRRADYGGPHRFFARVLGPDRGRLNLMRRLGAEAEDVLDEFLAQALAYERSHVPSLEGFLAALDAAATEIRRDADIVRDEVRVMTVHGAKGLEADIVFLVDGGMAPVHASHDPRIVALDDDRDGAVSPLVWMRQFKAMPDAVKVRVRELRDRAREEYLRLLYVGMTRARDRLYVCGTRKERATDDAWGWHGVVTRALAPELVAGSDAEGNVELEWRPLPGRAGRPRPPQPPLPLGPHRPDWLTRAAPPAPPIPERMAPSGVDVGDGGSEPPSGPIAVRREAGTQAVRRGRLIHRLLQSLPDIAPAERLSVAERYLAAVAPDLAEAERAAWIDEVLAVLDDPAFGEVFAPGSRAEVDIAGSLVRASGPATISGRVDRLAVTADRVFIVDYKTNRPAPERLADAPRDYIAQLALYRVVLRRLYPERAVAAALLWTDRPALMAIPEAALKAAETGLVNA